MEDRQKYKDKEMWEVEGKDTVQLKYDGIWCLAHVDGINIDYWSRHGKIKSSEINQHGIPNGKYIGELMFGSEWSQDPQHKGVFYVFDCIEFENVDCRNETYMTRYNKLAYCWEHKMWRLAQNFPFSQATELWDQVVIAQDFEGLVYRSSLGTWDETLYRQKASFTLDLEIVDYAEGEGRLAGTLGKIIASRMPKMELEATPLIHIGGGLSDALRAMLWSNQPIFSGRVIEVECKRIFKSGKLRHPNFVRFHPDKNDEDFINQYGTLK